MVGKQVITISLDGKLSGLDHKRKGLDLRQFGRAKTKRATLIEWNEDHQMWLIKWQRARHHSVCREWLASLFEQTNVNWSKYNGIGIECGYPDPIIFFDDYEDAVDAEVAVIQSLQLSGNAEKLFP